MPEARAPSAPRPDLDGRAQGQAPAGGAGKEVIVRASLCTYEFIKSELGNVFLFGILPAGESAPGQCVR